MDRPIMLVFHTLKARTSPTRAELCWFMDGVLPVLSRSCLTAPGAVFWQSGEGAEGWQDFLTCSCIRITLSLSPEKQQQCRDNPCRQGLKSTLPIESPPLPVPHLLCFPTWFWFLSWVLGLYCGPKRCQLVKASPHGTAWRTQCLFPCPATSRESHCMQNPQD